MRVVLLVFVVVSAACGEFDSSCGQSTYDYCFDGDPEECGRPPVQPGEQISIVRSGCNTCEHSSASLSWSYQQAEGDVLPTTGTFRLSVFGVCNGNYTGAHSMEVPWNMTEIDIRDVGARNICGDDAPMSVDATFTNNTDAPTPANMTLFITCPQLE